MPQTHYGTARWSLSLTPQQMRTCQALIITTPKEPDFVILLPAHYIRQKKEAHKDGSANFFTRGFRPLWTLHPLPAFPPELTPFVLPLSELGQAVADMRDYITGAANEW